MNTNLECLVQLSRLWWTWVWHSSWQSALVTGLVLGALAQGKRWNAPLRYAILLVALLKFAVPPLLPLPTGVFTWAAPAVHPSEQGAVGAAPDWRPAGESFSQSAESARGESASRSSVTSPGPSSGVLARGAAAARPDQFPTRSNIEWRLVLMLVHLVGLLAVMSWFGWQAGRLTFIRRSAQPVDGVAADIFAKLLQDLAFARAPQLLVSAEVASPVAYGILRPSVLLPATLTDRFTPAELRTVLAHELAHLRRRDLWVNAFELTLVACWWFHPCIWALRRALRRTREDCCDDLLLARGLTSNNAYCDVLVRAARELASGEPNCAALGLGEDLHPLARRLRRIMDKTLSRSARLSVSGAAIALVSAWLLLPGLKSEEQTELHQQLGDTKADSKDGVTQSSAPATAARLDEWFSHLRWVDERNLFFEDTRQTARQFGAQAVPFLVAKIQGEPGGADDARLIDARRKSVMALGMIAADLDRTIPALVRELDDDADLTDDPGHARVHLIPVNLVAADALGQIGPSASNAVPALTEAAEFGNGRALVALARIAPASPNVLSTLTNALRDFTKGRGLGLVGDYRHSALNAIGLAAASNPTALSALASALDDGDPQFRSAAAARLVEMRRDRPDAQRVVTEFLAQGTRRQRTVLAAALAKAGVKSDNLHRILMQGLQSKDADLMLPAIEGLATFRHQTEAIPLLVEVATRETGELRSAAVRALASIGQRTPEVVDALMQNLNAPDEFVRAQAVGTLGQFGKAAEKAEPQILELLHDPEPFVRQSAARALGEIRADPAKDIPALKAALEDPGYAVAGAAMSSLANFPELADEMIPVLIKALDGTNAWSAAIALGTLGPKAAPAVPALTRALASSGEGLRNNAANALGKIGIAAKPALPALELALKDADNGVRNNAAMALWKIDRRTEVINVLLERLRSEHALSKLERLNLKHTRLWDLKQLAEIGPPAKAAIPVLQSYLKDPDDDLRAAAQDALNAIQGTGQLRPSESIESKSLEQIFSEIEPFQIEMKRSQRALFTALLKSGENGIRFLLDQLKNNSQPTPAEAALGRAKAARLLGRLAPGAKESIPGLTAALEDGDDEVSDAAAQALANFGPEAASATPALLEALKFRNRSAPQALVKLAPGSHEVATNLLAMLGDPSTPPDFKVRVVNALPDLHAQREVVGPALIRAFKTADDYLRGEIASALQRLGDNSPEALALRRQLSPSPAPPRFSTNSVEELVEMLRHHRTRSEEVNATTGLMELGPKASNAVPALIDYLKNSKSRVRGNAVIALGRIGPSAKQAVPLLIDALDDDDLAVSGNVVFSLGEIGPAAKPALPKIEPLLRDASSNRRLHALVATVRIDPERGPELIPLIAKEIEVQDPRWPDRAWFIAGVLGELGPRAGTAVPVLERLTRERTNERAALAAAGALCRIDPGKRAQWIPLLTQALANPKGANRTTAAYQLGELGPLASDAVPLLQAAAQDEDGILRDSATHALAKVNSANR